MGSLGLGPWKIGRRKRLGLMELMLHSRRLSQHLLQSPAPLASPCTSDRLPEITAPRNSINSQKEQVIHLLEDCRLQLEKCCRLIRCTQPFSAESLRQRCQQQSEELQSSPRSPSGPKLASWEELASAQSVKNGYPARGGREELTIGLFESPPCVHEDPVGIGWWCWLNSFNLHVQSHHSTPLLLRGAPPSKATGAKPA